MTFNIYVHVYNFLSVFMLVARSCVSSISEQKQFLWHNYFCCAQQLHKNNEGKWRLCTFSSLKVCKSFYSVDRGDFGPDVIHWLSVLLYRLTSNTFTERIWGLCLLCGSDGTLFATRARYTNSTSIDGYFEILLKAVHSMMYVSSIGRDYAIYCFQYARLFVCL